MKEKKRKKGKREKMDKILRNNDKLMNDVAFSYLLEYGRKNILDDNFYNNEIKEIEKGKHSFLMTPEFKKEILEIARYMAKMKDKDLKNYVFSIVKEERKMLRDR